MRSGAGGACFPRFVHAREILPRAPLPYAAGITDDQTNDPSAERRPPARRRPRCRPTLAAVVRPMATIAGEDTCTYLPADNAFVRPE